MKEQIDRYARGLFEYDPLVAIADEKNIFVVVKEKREDDIYLKRDIIVLVSLSQQIFSAKCSNRHQIKALH